MFLKLYGSTIDFLKTLIKFLLELQPVAKSSGIANL